MIVSFIFYTVGWMVAQSLILVARLSASMNAIPYLPQSFKWIAGSLNYFGGVLDVATIFQVITFVIGYITLIYALKLFFWLLSAFPFLGKLSNRFFKEGSGEANIVRNQRIVQRVRSDYDKAETRFKNSPWLGRRGS